MPGSSDMIGQSGKQSEEANKLNSMTQVYGNGIGPSSALAEMTPGHEIEGESTELDSTKHDLQKFVVDSTNKSDATLDVTVVTNTDARNVRVCTPLHHVKTGPPEDTALSLPDAATSHVWHPKYLRYNYWSLDIAAPTSLVDWTIEAKPMPRPPASELTDANFISLMHSYGDLFKITTPMNVDVFASMLLKHPNQPFV
ncbi:hypothetical protein C0991_010049, partial [Blastosporella zonata]